MVERWLRIEKKLSITIIYFIIIFFLSSISHAQSSIQGKVISVADGDTITVLQNSKQYKIRLYGIDTPEKKQDFGQKAKFFTSNQNKRRQCVYNRLQKLSLGKVQYIRKQ